MHLAGCTERFLNTEVLVKLCFSKVCLVVYAQQESLQRGPKVTVRYNIGSISVHIGAFLCALGLVISDLGAYCEFVWQGHRW